MIIMQAIVAFFFSTRAAKILMRPFDDSTLGAHRAVPEVLMALIVTSGMLTLVHASKAAPHKIRTLDFRNLPGRELAS